MLSTHLYLGLPCDLLVRGFHLKIYSRLFWCLAFFVRDRTSLDFGH
jgi:hypothetical protein